MISFYQGDITSNRNQSIVVTAANFYLKGGGGVDGAVHHAAGPKLLFDCQKLKYCATGKCVVTNGYWLSPFVIHAVGQIYHLAYHKQACKDLLSVYSDVFNKANRLFDSGFKFRDGMKPKRRTISLPAISTGVYHFPVDLAAAIALKAAKPWINLMDISFWLYDEETFKTFVSEAELIHMPVLNKLRGTDAIYKRESN